MCSLRAGLARAEVTIDADRAEQPAVLAIEGGGVIDRFGIAQLAAQRQGEPAVLAVAAEHWSICCAADREKALAIRQFNELR